MMTKNSTKNKSYAELSKLKTFKERYDYLKLNGVVGEDTFGADRYLNQALYTSPEWRRFRNQIIIRDGGCDLGIEGYDLEKGQAIIHHMNSVTKKQIVERDPVIFDPNNVITVSHKTHNAIHYGDESLLQSNNMAERKPGDTKLW